MVCNEAGEFKLKRRFVEFSEGGRYIGVQLSIELEASDFVSTLVEGTFNCCHDSNGSGLVNRSKVKGRRTC